MEDVTRILKAVEAGQTEAAEELLPLAYKELKRIAANKMALEREGHTLQPTALVHEAYLRMSKGSAYQDRAHFFAVAATAMRQVLLNHVRSRNPAWRQGRLRVALDAEQPAELQMEVDLLALDEALDRLHELDPRKSKVVEMRFFGGLTMADVARVLTVSKRTAEQDWHLARAWLSRELSRL